MHGYNIKDNSITDADYCLDTYSITCMLVDLLMTMLT